MGRLRILIAICYPLFFTSLSVGHPTEAPRSAGASINVIQKNDESAQQPELTEQTTAELIEQLDAIDFAIREDALGKLAKLGASAIGPLAEKSFECSAETKWRIKKTLEAICTNGDEDVFYKALGVINVRFEVGPHSNNLNNSLQLLEKQWRKKRKTDVIKRLKKLGAEVNDPLEGMDDQLGFQAVGANFMMVNGGVIEVNNGFTKIQPGKRRIKKAANKLSDKEIKAEIKSILESNTDENRERVFGTKKLAENKSSLASTPNSPQDAQRAAIQQALMLQARNRIRVNNQVGAFSLGTGITIEFGNDWKGSNADIRLIRDLENVTRLVFADQSIDANLISDIQGNSTLQQLKFDGCELDEGVLKQGKWQSLREIEFKNFDVDPKLIQSLVPLSSLQMLTFEACQVEDAALGKLKDMQGLRGLQFKDTEIDQSIFKILAVLKKVTYVNLSVCKFQVTDYKALKKSRPSLQIAYTAQAFFGVRGPINTGLARPVFDAQGRPIGQGLEAASNNCTISEVISGSGADRGGIKVGDIIESVNEQKIEQFEDLRLHIAQHQAGETIAVEVSRNGKPIKLEVELTSPDSAPRF